MNHYYPNDLIKKLHEREAQTSITSSALRNQGPSGTIKIVRTYLTQNIDLSEFFSALVSPIIFQEYLDEKTISLKATLPRRGELSMWGAARKSLNLFFRSLVYNKIIFDHYSSDQDPLTYDRLIAPLEIPLDSHSAAGLKELYPELTKWTGIVNLTPEISHKYQGKAQELAAQTGYARIHLDMEFWRQI